MAAGPPAGCPPHNQTAPITHTYISGMAGGKRVRENRVHTITRLYNVVISM